MEPSGIKAIIQFETGKLPVSFIVSGNLVGTQLKKYTFHVGFKWLHLEHLEISFRPAYMYIYIYIYIYIILNFIYYYNYFF